MVDIEKEGYVSVQNNSIPLRNYLFYLTYNDRAISVNNMESVDLTSSNIYGASKDYYVKRHSESTVDSVYEKGEIVLSFSSRLCYLVTEHKFRKNIKFFKKDFERTVNQIIEDNLEQPEYSVFVHEYDSSQMRVHAHVLFYPYLDSNISLPQIDGGEMPLRPLKMWVDPERLRGIKKQFNDYARQLYKGLETFDKSTPKELPSASVDRDSLFNLIKISPKHTPKYMKEEFHNLWSTADKTKLIELLRELSQTHEDTYIRGNKDFSMVVDYLYDFNDEQAYKLFFGHAAIQNIIKDFSVFKSNPKFSSVFLKLISITKDSGLIDIIKNKTNSTKAQELINIIAEYYTDDPDRVYEQDIRQGLVQGHNQ